MADWRQIQARIRKAKNSPDAQAKLFELFQRTRDAMVAWELGAIEEKAEHKDEAGNWYTIAAQRFRRADWKKKAEDALTRLGLELPPRQAEIHTTNQIETRAETSSAEGAEESHAVQSPLAFGEVPMTTEEHSTPEVPTPASGIAIVGDSGHRKRRRGRRGGRGRRRKGAPTSGLPTQAFTGSPESRRPEPQAPRAPALERPAYQPPAPDTVSFVPARAAQVEPPPAQLPSERTAHGRAGDPALASRMAHLESMLRRLVASPLHRLDEADEAPAGPGVFLLSDSDQITSYYVEACQTLRIGCSNLVRGGRGGKGGRGGRGYSDSGLKVKLSEYLGISEAKVSQYMRDHCVIRWIQLDDDAPLLAHFAIGVLRTPLNLD
ncbi:MAG TPA: hypothetical protein VJO53_09020 [Candidatus Acidoferrales bacterium]|nr:hypothetical protein [Candidatus Acidoferrales bacterium]